MIFLKLGGSLITDKSKLQTARLEMIGRLAAEISEAFRFTPEMKLLLGHGSGSFGHPVAERYGTHRGAKTADDWLGFAQVWAIANRLNRLVMDALLEASLPAISLPPSASALCQNGKIVEMAIEPIQSALNAGLLPVVQGDAAFDIRKGSAILSTEEVFHYLAPHLQPSLVLFAGIEPGVYRDYPSRSELLRIVTEKDLH
jgi:isopentenyl phosphate kinase